MAKSTKSKATKTTKKPVKAVKATAAKSTKKLSTKSNASKATATSNKSVKPVLGPLDRIRSMHVSKTLVYLIFTGLVTAFAVTNAVAVKLGHQTRDQFASGPEVVLGSANEVIANIEPKYVLALALLTSAVFSILLATKLRNRYEATLANNTSGFRWLALGLSSALVLVFINLAAGVNDYALLKLSALLIFMAAMLSFVADRENAKAARPKWLAYDLGLLAGVMAWLPLLASMLGTTLYGMERFGWHIYALAAAALVGFTAIAITQFRQIRAGAQRDYLSAEERYLRIDMLTKFAVVIIVILAFK